MEGVTKLAYRYTFQEYGLRDLGGELTGVGRLDHVIQKAFIAGYSAKEEEAKEISKIIEMVKLMPELEVGDWYQSTRNGINTWINGPIGKEDRAAECIIEIRKADGTVWKK